MALTRTTLAAAVTRDSDIFYLTAVTGLAAGHSLKVNDEFSTVVSISGLAVRVRTRGERGGKAVAHGILSPVVYGPAADFGDVQSNIMAGGFDEIAAGVDGAIAIPTRNTRVNITKATAAAMTLTAPGVATPDGIILEIRGYTAAAHTVTLTAGFYGNTTSSDVATFAAGGGGVLTLKSLNGIWLVVGGATAGVTLG